MFRRWHKGLKAFLGMALGIAVGQGAVITRWDFNSFNSDGDPSTGTLDPAAGQGSAAIIGVNSQSFGSVAGGATSDPAASDNSQVRLAGFPPQGTGNKTAGLEFRASTAGFRSIRLLWDQENSGSASRYWRIQYTLDGLAWEDYEVVPNTAVGSWVSRSVSFDGVEGAGDNPNFGVRIVSEFEDTASGGGAPEYRAIGATANYSTAGTFWIDMVTFEGEPLGGEDPPPPPPPPTNQLTIAVWDFNSAVPDNDPATGSLDPIGNGAAVVPIGGVSASFGSVGGGETSSGPLPDNTMLRLGSFPSVSEANKSAGIELRASTAGRKNIILAWDHYNSNTGSRYWRVQYSTNGIDFVDHSVFINSTPGAWRLANTVSFAELPEVNGNPDFAVRLVSEFERTAIGFGADAYDAVNEASSYSANGTLWLDMITISGEPTGDPTPGISSIGDQIITENESLPPLPLVLSDPGLVLHAESDNPELIASVLIEGAGTERTVMVITHAGRSGTARITITASSAGGISVATSFTITILPVQTPPVLEIEPQVTTAVGHGALRVPFVVTDAQEHAESLQVGIEGFIEFASVAIEGEGMNRVMVVEPLTEGFGVIRLTASDGLLQSDAEVAVRVLAADVISLWDFNLGHESPAFGSGTLTPIGGVSASIEELAEPGPDPAPENAALRLIGFPAQQADNKSAGVELRVGTAGYWNIQLSWQQRQSDEASRSWRVQYSTNGTDFVDHIAVGSANPGAWEFHVVDFTGVAGAANNEAFTVRLVAEFDGAGYAPANNSSAYSPDGVVWLDLLTLSGSSVPPPNAPPVISEIAGYTTGENSPTGPIPFTVWDDQTPPESLIIILVSSNPDLVSQMELGGSGANRTLTLYPNTDQVGETEITVRVLDGEGAIAERSFILTVERMNTAPVISAIEPQTTAGVLRLPFTVFDREQPAEQLLVGAEVIDRAIADVVVKGSGSNRLLELTPRLEGTTTVVIFASDRMTMTRLEFELTVVAPEPPSISIRLVEGEVEFTVPSGFILESCTNLLNAEWQVVNGTRVPAIGARQFFRYRR